VTSECSTSAYTLKLLEKFNINLSEYSIILHFKDLFLQAKQLIPP